MRMIFKAITNIISHPKILILESAVGITVIHYFQDIIMEAVIYLFPTIFVVIADLFWGIQAARTRKEKVTFSSAVRRTFNKIVGYGCWILFCTAMGVTYHYKLLPALMMVVVFTLEGSSCINNILERSDKQLSIHGVLKLIGKKTHYEGLEDCIEDKDKNDVKSNNK